MPAQGFDADQRIKVCGEHTIVRAHLYYGMVIDVHSPDLVGAMGVSIGSVPLDRSTAEATRNMLMRAAQNHAVQEKKSSRTKQTSPLNIRPGSSFFSTDGGRVENS